MSKDDRKWNTKSEIDYINKIKSTRDFTKLELLKKYKEGLLKRTNFGDINKETIFNHIDKKIKMEEKCKR